MVNMGHVHLTRKQTFGDMVSAILEGKPDKNLILVTGRTHPKLAAEVAEQLGIDVLETTAYDFANGEMYVRYTESVRGRGRVRTAKSRSSDQSVDHGAAHHD